MVFGARESIVLLIAVAVAVPVLLVARMVRLRAWPLAPVMPVLEQVKAGALPDTVAASQVDPPSVLYSQLVRASPLENEVARSKGLLTKSRYCWFEAVTVPGTGGAAEGV